MTDGPDTSASSKHRPVCHRFLEWVREEFRSLLGRSFYPTSDPVLGLLRSRFSRILRGMEVRFTTEQEAQLAQIASRSGTDPERLVKEAALRLLEEEARFRAAVREGIAQADRGELLEEEEMDARFEQMLRSE